MTERDKKWLRELVRRCGVGDKQGWAELIALLQPKILLTCRQMRLSREDSLDVFGQVCYLLLRNLRAVKEPDKIVSYVITMTRREVLLRDRRDKLLGRVEKEAAEIDPRHPPDTPDKLLDDRETSNIILIALSRLSAKEERLMYMLFLDSDEPSYEEISASLGMPVSSIGPTRLRLLKKLRRMIK